jgi:hypothetical protein
MEMKLYFSVQGDPRAECTVKANLFEHANEEPGALQIIIPGDRGLSRAFALDIVLLRLRALADAVNVAVAPSATDFKAIAVLAEEIGEDDPLAPLEKHVAFPA